MGEKSEKKPEITKNPIHKESYCIGCPHLRRLVQADTGEIWRCRALTNISKETMNNMRHCEEKNRKKK